MTCGGPVCSRQVVMGRFYPNTRREPQPFGRAPSFLVGFNWRPIERGVSVAPSSAAARRLKQRPPETTSRRLSTAYVECGAPEKPARQLARYWPAGEPGIAAAAGSPAPSCCIFS
jgi:hypothetical protein